MDKLLEKEIEKRLGKLLEAKGCLYFKFESPGNPGVPDRLVITPSGRTIFVELKTKIGRLSSIQKWQIDRMTAHGADVRKIQGWDEAKQFAEEVITSEVRTAPLPGLLHPAHGG